MDRYTVRRVILCTEREGKWLPARVAGWISATVELPLGASAEQLLAEVIASVKTDSAVSIEQLDDRYALVKGVEGMPCFEVYRQR